MAIDKIDVANNPSWPDDLNLALQKIWEGYRISVEPRLD